MSYAGMGFTPITGLKTSTPLPVTGSAPTGGPGAMPADLVQAISNALNANFAASDATGQKIRAVGLLLALLVRNSKSTLVGAQAVLQLLLSVLSTTPGGNAWINNAFASSDYAPLRSMTIESIVQDIGNGRYKPAPATPPAASVFSLARSNIGGGGVSPPLAPPPSPPTAKVAPPPVSPTQPEVQCTDGYFRDATGLCVPNAAPPGPPAQPDVSQVTAPPPVDISEARPPCPPGMYMLRDGSCIPPGAPTPGSLLVDGSGRPTPVSPPPSTVAPSDGPLGIGLKWWVLGAAGIGIAAIAYRSSSKSVVANKRRRKKRS
jgi:hypothetical protein